MTFSEQISDDLLRLGVEKGTPLLVHSSVKSLGINTREIGLEPVIQGLLMAVGKDGTLLMVSGTWRYVTPENPVFDVRNTPTNVGTLPEYLRKRPGTKRSVNPTHSVCGVGPHTGDLLDRHHLDDTPCGANSPYRLLSEISGKILFLGCGLAPNTSMHGVEELVMPPYLFSPRKIDYTVIREDGTTFKRNCWRHSFGNYGQRYERLAGLLRGKALLRGKVLAAECFLVDARTVWEEGAKAMRQDPFYFVELNKK